VFGVVRIPAVIPSPRTLRAFVIALLLTVTLVSWVPSTAAIEGDLTVASGETLVVDEDLEVGGDVYVNGTLVIDGSTFQTYTGSWPDEVCNIFIYGTLRIVNGSMLTGDFHIIMGPSGSLEVRDSEVVCSSSQMYCIDHSPGSVWVVNSTISTNYVLLWCEGANVSLVNSTVETLSLDAITSTINVEGCEMLMDRVKLTTPSQGVTGWGGGNATVRDCRVQASGTYAMSFEGLDDVSVTGTIIRRGNAGILAMETDSVTVDRTTFEGLDGAAAQVSWSGNVSVSNMTVDRCKDAALNITNCTNVTVTALDVEGITGDGIGLMAEHDHGFTATDVAVRYADRGVYMIHTDDVILDDIRVDWCRVHGLKLSYCKGVDVSRLSATSAGVDGLYAGYCKGLSVEDSDLDGADECGAFLTHTPTSMASVTARGCGQYGVRAAVNSVFMVGCDLSYNGLDGFLSLDQGGAGLTDCIVEGNGGNGTRFVGARGPFLKGCKVSDNRDAGVLFHYETRAGDVIDSDIQRNGWGVVLNGPTSLSQASSATIRYTDIHNNTEGGARNWLSNTSDLDARWCWWGNNTGPRNETRNANGTGDYIEGGVRFVPWLRRGNLVPVIEGPSDLEVTEEEVDHFIYDVDDLDDDPNKVRFGLAGAPGNVSIDPTSGILTVAPEDAEVGTHSFFVTATDERGGTGRFRVTLTVIPVNDPPQLLIPPDGVTVTDDELLGWTVPVYDPDDPRHDLEWSLISGPTFVDLSPDGILEGTTTWQGRGDHVCAVHVSDPAGGEDTDNVVLHVVAHYEPIIISGLNTTTAFEGRPYLASILITHDPEADLEWEFLSNASWLVLDASHGTLVGTPALRNVGTCSVHLTVSDQFGFVTDKEITIQVVPFNDPPFWDDLPTEVLISSAQWDLDLSRFARDVDDPAHTLSFSVDGLDRRLKVQGHFIVGAFTRGQDDAVVNVTVTDPHGASSTQLMRMVVEIPDEDDPTLIVSSIYPWIAVALVVAVVLALLLQHRERTRREREGGT
jgi:hypothetical protein